MGQDKYYKQMYEHLKTFDVKTSLDELKAVFSYRKMEKGQHFVTQGEIEREIAFICQGMMRYYYITIDGEDVTKHFTMENDFSASYASLIYNRPTAYSIVCEETCHLLVMNRDMYVSSIDSDRRWERLARLYTENIYNHKEIREAALLTLNAKDRYLAFLNQFPNIEKRLKQKHIATYLGIHPVSLSRLKKSLNN